MSRPFDIDHLRILVGGMLSTSTSPKTRDQGFNMMMPALGRKAGGFIELYMARADLLDALRARAEVAACGG